MVLYAAGDPGHSRVHAGTEGADDVKVVVTRRPGHVG